MVFIEPQEVSNLYDYLTTLTTKEREQLARETNYSAAYFNLLVSTKKNLSEFLAIKIEASKFNRTPSKNGARVTKKMLEDHINLQRSIRMRLSEKRGVTKKRK
jgi:hypothetical protein